MWNITFISENDFRNHVKLTIQKYGEKLESFDLQRFNKNIIDPIKLIFDKTAYGELKAMADRFNVENEDMKFALSVFLLSFHTYNGFRNREESKL